MASPQRPKASGVEEWIARGAALLQAGDKMGAREEFRCAVSMAPDSPMTQAYFGTALLETGDYPGAAAALRRAHELDPNFVEALYNLGLALQRGGDATGAETAWRRATKINPFYLKPWNNLALALEARGDMAAARATFEEGLKHAPPDDVGAGELCNNLGNLLEQAGELEAALAACERAVALLPQNARLRLNLGTLLLGIGRVEAGAIHLAQARALDPGLQAATHAYLLGQLYRNDDPSAPLAAARSWAAGLPVPPPLPHANPRDPGRRLRVGYVSPDFCRHVVSCFIEPVLAAHDRNTIEVWCYASVRKPDNVTERFRRMADHWRDVVEMDDEALAAQIRADGIDILIDLAGHTIGSRLAAFARRPAPIQLSWLGYPATTGVQQIDARIVDALTDPPGLTESQNCEKLLRLPGGFNCYRPPDDAPSVGSLPAAANGHVTFGSFNHAAKITPEALRLWAALLRVVPTARLLIKHRGFDVGAMRDACLAEFAKHGAAAERIDLVAHISDVTGHLGTYNRVDVSLDSFPYNGTTTTCESLWMGVPVVTLAGASHRARVGASLLTRAGYPGLVAATPREYVDIAAGLAGNLTALAKLRAGLRAAFAASPVCDGAALTRHLEDSFRSLWRTWCSAS